MTSSTTMDRKEKEAKGRRNPPGGSKIKLQRRYKCQKVARWTNNGYLNFLRGYKMRHCGFLSPTDMVKYGAREWQTLTPEQKARYKIKPGTKRRKNKRRMAKKEYKINKGRKRKHSKRTEDATSIGDCVGSCHCLRDNAMYPELHLRPAEVPPVGEAAASNCCLQDGVESPEPLLPSAEGAGSPSDGGQKH